MDVPVDAHKSNRCPCCGGERGDAYRVMMIYQYRDKKFLRMECRRCGFLVNKNGNRIVCNKEVDCSWTFQ